MNKIVIYLSLLLSCYSVSAEHDLSWSDFKEVYIIDNGRVIDGSDPRSITTSEGQSYALFFALVENDRATFDLVYEWTRHHLAGGDLTARLPSWLWGKGNNGYEILDTNSASDSDLWIAYTLLEAGRLWKSDYYQNVGYLLAQRILAEETISLVPGVRQLVPGKYGFEVDKAVKLNPSYVPMPLLAKFVHSSTDKRWTELWSGSRELLLRSQVFGVSPDWILYDGQDYYFDNETDDQGSYNAIRTYMWAGMMPRTMEGREQLLKTLRPFVNQIRTEQSIPLTTFAQSGKSRGSAPVGFTAAMIPLLVANEDDELAQIFATKTKQQLQTKRDDEYYNNVLAWFGMSWYNKRFRFDDHGELILPWANSEALTPEVNEQ
ncbi:endo-1,4-D-glucanase [Vibrio sp. 10N.286.49.C2]|uniref:cellulose synthase complex periplasmic endoglucanase BcsZ n=1 Tax=unclassified Vibrio TaxID=2614977 RepID=UPI000C8664D4|nr:MULTISPECIES: cellulose synthase complex periplasmic endoglucanase BcsZ [unclassified Vibrio]PMH34829.1 endo-1,4-D-glucanase [Vibrio sp. 10N.286.49.C2]PMH51383.1 endo-1,4-D-glucanase [Vibrio sp. 10N.286.49.B1]PMH83626.1 endo-1,4-D-glucanase [Vibrio sp. 10N.286.48.B7]